MSHPDEKSLVFSQFVSEMDIIHELLAQGGVKVFRIDGSVSLQDRVKAIKDFQKYKGHTAFLIQIKAGGQGLNLQEATRVYITAPSWNPATELQAIARAHRTGQTKKVTVRKLIYSGTDQLPSVEDSIMNLQGHKSMVCAEVLNDPRLSKQIPTNSKKNITIRDLKKIFQV
jgi:SNF2 family DNA or RNA helicase